MPCFFLIYGKNHPDRPPQPQRHQGPENQPEKIIFFQKRLGVEALKSVHGQIIIPRRPYSTAPAIGECFLLHQRVDDAEEIFSRLEA